MTTEAVAPSKPKSRGWVITAVIIGIAAVFAAVVIGVAVHTAAQHREKVCESEYGFEGYDPVQAKILCNS